MKYLLLVMVMSAFLSPSLSFAAHIAGHGCAGPDDASPGCPAYTPGGPGLSFTIISPLEGIGSIEGLLTAILNILIILAVPIIVFFIIFAGFSYVTAAGNPEKIKTATRSLTYAVIGGVLILGAVALSQIIQGIVDSFRAGG